MRSLLISVFKFFYLFNDILIDFFGLDKKELYESLNYGEFSDSESAASEAGCNSTKSKPEPEPEPESEPETKSEPPADHKVEVNTKSEVTYEKTIRITLDLLVGANGLGFILPPGTMPIHSQPPPAPQPEPPTPDIQPEPAPTINLSDTKISLDFGSQVPPRSAPVQEEEEEQEDQEEQEEENDDATHSSMPDLEPISEEDDSEMNKEINSKYDFIDEYLEHRRSVIPDFQLKKYAKKLSEEDVAPHTDVIDVSVSNN